MPELTIIRAVLTRWTAHFLAYSRLLEVRTQLQALAADPSKMVTGDRNARIRAEIMVAIINNAAFWEAIAR